MLKKETVLRRILAIEKKLAEIWKNNQNFSLYTGIGGLPLFYAMLYELTKNQVYKKK